MTSLTRWTHELRELVMDREAWCTWSHLFLGKDGETVETVTDFILEGSKTTVEGDCSHEIKSHLLLERKAMTNLDSILKS